MPTYEYRCPSCQHEFEKIQRMAEDPVAECPKCGAEAQRRLSGGAGLLFKGSGFYITDYRSDSYKKAAGAEAGSGSASDSKSEAGGGTDKGSTSGTSDSATAKPKAEPKAGPKAE